MTTNTNTQGTNNKGGNNMKQMHFEILKDNKILNIKIDVKDLNDARKKIVEILKTTGGTIANPAVVSSGNKFKFIEMKNKKVKSSFYRAWVKRNEKKAKPATKPTVNEKEVQEILQDVSVFLKKDAQRKHSSEAIETVLDRMKRFCLDPKKEKAIDDVKKEVKTNKGFKKTCQHFVSKVFNFFKKVGNTIKKFFVSVKNGVIKLVAHFKGTNNKKELKMAIES